MRHFVLVLPLGLVLLGTALAFHTWPQRVGEGHVVDPSFVFGAGVCAIAIALIGTVAAIYAVQRDRQYRPLLRLSLVAGGIMLALLALPDLLDHGNHVDVLLAFHSGVATAVIGLLGLLATLVVIDREWLRPRWAEAGPARRAATVLVGLVAFEVWLGVMYWLTRHQGVEQLGYLRAIFYLSGEGNLPAVFSSLQLLAVAGLAYACARPPEDAVRRSAWLPAALICLYLGLDELFAIHEQVGLALRTERLVDEGAGGTVQVGPAIGRAWTVVYLPLALVAGLLLARGFWRALTPARFALMMLAFVTFVGGAVGVENLAASLVASGDVQKGSDALRMLLVAEELLEMFGVTLAVYVFAREWFDRQQRLRSELPPGLSDAA
jgi:hypothetical protein